MATFDHYTNPPFHEYDWSAVDWDEPTNDDLVALYELAESVRKEWFVTSYNLYHNGGSKDDLPRMTTLIWYGVIVATGLAEDGKPDKDFYNNVYGLYHFAGERLYHERVWLAMTPEEREESVAHSEAMESHLAPLLEEAFAELNLEARLAEYEAHAQARDAEINTLNALLEGE